jgi:hypothetical protein
MDTTSSNALRKSQRPSQLPQDDHKNYYLVKYLNERTYGVVEKKYVQVIDKSNLKCVVVSMVL